MNPEVHVMKSGGHAVLREVRIEDAAIVLKSLQKMAGESEFLSEGQGGYNFSLEEEERFIQRHLDHPNALFLVAQVEHEIMGLLTFAPGDKKRTAHQGEFGMGVLKECWGQGIGQRLLEILIQWAKNNKAIERIVLNVHAHNERGRSLYRKLGFVEEGLQRKSLKFKDGRYGDNVLMALWVGD